MVILRVASLLWLVGGITLAVFADPLAHALVAAWRGGSIQVRARRTLLVVGIAEVVVGGMFLAGLGLLGTAANLLVLTWLLARLGRPDS